MSDTLPQLSLPPCSLKTRVEDGQLLVLDATRKKWVALTPEEWVRQHVAGFLTKYRDVRAGMVAVESELDFDGYRRRADIVVYRSDGVPVLVVECKAADVNLSQRAVDQVARYNHALGAATIMVTNGLQHFVFSAGTEPPSFLPDLPDYAELLRFQESYTRSSAVKAGR